MKPLAGLTALITGGMGGIGRATVHALLDRGAAVVITYVNGIDAAPDVHSFCVARPNLSALSLDLGDPASISACLDAAFDRPGGIDILVNNAAVGSATVARFSDDPQRQDSLMLAINADGTLKMCQGFLQWAALDPARPRKIINLSSVGGGIATFPGFRLSDGMSKAAVAHLTRQLAAENARTNVDVFALCPGATNTPMFQASTLDPMPPETRAAFLDQLPKQRLIEPQEIAGLIAFLASDAAAVLHGAVIDASMGLGVRPGLITEFAH